MSADAARTRPQWLYAVVGGLVAVGGLVLLLLAALFGFSLFGGGRHEPAKIVDKAGTTVFILGQVQDLSGSNLVRVNITAAERSDENPYGSLSSGGGVADTRNILLLNKTTGATRKLLPDNSRRIIADQFLAAETDSNISGPPGVVRNERSSPPAYYLLTVASANDEKRLDVLVGTLATGRQAFVMRNVAGVESIWMQTPTRIGTIVREGLGLHYRIVDVPTLQVVASRSIDIG